MSSSFLDRLWPAATPQGVEKRLKQSGIIVIYAFSIKFSTKIRIKFEKQEKNEKTDKKAPPTAPRVHSGACRRQENDIAVRRNGAKTHSRPKSMPRLMRRR